MGDIDIPEPVESLFGSTTNIIVPLNHTNFKIIDKPKQDEVPHDNIYDPVKLDYRRLRIDLEKYATPIIQKLSSKMFL